MFHTDIAIGLQTCDIVTFENYQPLFLQQNKTRTISSKSVQSLSTLSKQHLTNLMAYFLIEILEI
jgi:hypothetical protein